MVVDPVREEISTALRISNFAADKSISCEAFDPLLATEEKSSPPGRSPSPTRRLSPKGASGFQHPRHRSSRSYFWARARKRRSIASSCQASCCANCPLPIALTKRKPSSPNARFGCSTTEASWPRSKPCCGPGCHCCLECPDCLRACRHPFPDARTLAHKRADALTTWATRCRGSQPANPPRSQASKPQKWSLICQRCWG